jgi:hypothetical protein
VAAVAIVTSIPGMSRTAVEMIVAEIGADMDGSRRPDNCVHWRGWRRRAKSPQESDDRQAPARCAVAATCGHRLLVPQHGRRVPLSRHDTRASRTRREQSYCGSCELDAFYGLASAEHGRFLPDSDTEYFERPAIEAKRIEALGYAVSLIERAA